MTIPTDPTLLINALAPDPCDVGALLHAAVDERCARTGETREAIARLCGMDPGNLSRALRNPDARAATVRAVCKALGLRVALVPTK